jgi:hypothetical protein
MQEVARLQAGHGIKGKDGYAQLMTSDFHITSQMINLLNKFLLYIHTVMNIKSSFQQS